jgi:hypothetical protein
MPRVRTIQSPFFRKVEVVELLRGAGLLARCIQGGWLAPCVRDPKTVLFRRDDVLEVIARLEAGEMPPPLKR